MKNMARKQDRPLSFYEKLFGLLAVIVILVTATDMCSRTVQLFTAYLLRFNCSVSCTILQG